MRSKMIEYGCQGIKHIRNALAEVENISGDGFSKKSDIYFPEHIAQNICI